MSKSSSPIDASFGSHDAIVLRIEFPEAFHLMTTAIRVDPSLTFFELAEELSKRHSFNLPRYTFRLSYKDRPPINADMNQVVSFYPMGTTHMTLVEKVDFINDKLQRTDTAGSVSKTHPANTVPLKFEFMDDDKMMQINAMLTMKMEDIMRIVKAKKLIQESAPMDFQIVYKDGDRIIPDLRHPLGTYKALNIEKIVLLPRVKTASFQSPEYHAVLTKPSTASSASPVNKSAKLFLTLPDTREVQPVITLDNRVNEIIHELKRQYKIRGEYRLKIAMVDGHRYTLAGDDHIDPSQVDYSYFLEPLENEDIAKPIETITANFKPVGKRDSERESPQIAKLIETGDFESKKASGSDAEKKKNRRQTPLQFEEQSKKPVALQIANNGERFKRDINGTVNVPLNSPLAALIPSSQRKVLDVTSPFTRSFVNDESNIEAEKNRVSDRFESNGSNLSQGADASEDDAIEEQGESPKKPVARTIPAAKSPRKAVNTVLYDADLHKRIFDQDLEAGDESIDISLFYAQEFNDQAQEAKEAKKTKSTLSNNQRKSLKGLSKSLLEADTKSMANLKLGASKKLSATEISISATLPDSSESHITLPISMTMSALLEYVCRKCALLHELYDIEIQGHSEDLIDMTKPLSDYIKCQQKGEEGDFRIRIIKKESKVSMSYVNEGGKDVLVLQKTGDKTEVMAGTLQKLMERLTNDQEKDNSFLHCFLMTHRHFMDGKTLLDELAGQFYCELAVNPSKEDILYFQKIKIPTQIRVLKAIHYWISNFWIDFEQSETLAQELKSFFMGILSYTDHNFVQESHSLINLMEKKRAEYQSELQSLTSSSWEADEFLNVQEMSPRALAEQLCICNLTFIRAIHPVELLDEIWKPTDRKSEALKIFIDRFNRESYWSAVEVLGVRDFKKRVLKLAKMIHIAAICEEFGNFFSLFAILAGLNMSAVQRLEQTWESLPPKSKDEWNRLESITNPSKNMKAYRDRIQKASPPVIPFLPMYLKDLTFMNDGNPTYTRGLLNFDKMRTMSDTVQSMKDLIRVNYKFQPDSNLQSFLALNQVERSDEALKQMSLACE